MAQSLPVKLSVKSMREKLNSNTYTQDDLIKMVVSDLNDRYSKDEVEEIVKSLESNIITCLTDVKDDKIVTIRPFTGLVLSSKVSEERTIHSALSHLDQKDYVKPKGIKVSTKFTTRFRHKMASKYTGENV